MYMEAANQQTAGAFVGGFVYRGERFSLSLASQVSIQSLYAIRYELTEAVPWMNIDDTATILLEDAGQVADFHAAMALAVIALRTAGVTTKSELNQETP